MKRIVLSMGLLTAIVLQACAGNSVAPQSPAVAPQSADTDMGPLAQSATAQAALPASETIGSGEIFGLDNQFTPNDGSPQNTTVDGVPCATSMITNKYHIHSFVGIIINGSQKALPDGAGMYGPGADGTYYGVPNWTEYAKCYYWLHTHDASGVVHVESASTASNATATLYTLGTFFDIWHQTLSTTQIGPYTGTVRVYVAQVHHTSPSTSPAPSQITRTMYTLYTGNPRNIPLYTHTTTWLEIGPTYVAPSSLPVLNYYEEW